MASIVGLRSARGGPGKAFGCSTSSTLLLPACLLHACSGAAPPAGLPNQAARQCYRGACQRLRLPPAPRSATERAAPYDYEPLAGEHVTAV